MKRRGFMRAVIIYSDNKEGSVVADIVNSGRIVLPDSHETRDGERTGTSTCRGGQTNGKSSLYFYRHRLARTRWESRVRSCGLDESPRIGRTSGFSSFVGFVGLGWTLLDRASSLISHTPIRKARIEDLCVSFLPCLRFM